MDNKLILLYMDMHVVYLGILIYDGAFIREFLICMGWWMELYEFIILYKGKIQKNR